MGILVTTTEPPPAWTDVSTIASSDTNSSIFSKLTTMVKNVRWLYSKLGTEDFSITGSDTVSGSLNNLQSELDGKSPSSHTHSTSSLPVSNNQVNSANYIPTSALLYSMSQRADGIQSIVSLAKRELDDPNKRYGSKDLGAWNSVSDVDSFLSTYNHANNYEGLHLGSFVTINDGVYNTNWYIAGFDMECGQKTSNGVIYDNGYGICLIPVLHVVYDKWDTSGYTHGEYISSTVHTNILPTVVSNLRNVLGDHIVNRLVLLSSSDIDNNGISNGFEWSNAYATLMSVGQLTGTFASHNNQYDDGEASYKLPVFDYIPYYNTAYNQWTRCIYNSTNVYVIGTNGSIYSNNAASNSGIRPMIYIR